MRHAKMCRHRPANDLRRVALEWTIYEAQREAGLQCRIQVQAGCVLTPSNGWLHALVRSTAGRKFRFLSDVLGGGIRLRVVNDRCVCAAVRELY